MSLRWTIQIRLSIRSRNGRRLKSQRRWRMGEDFHCSKTEPESCLYHSNGGIPIKSDSSITITYFGMRTNTTQILPRVGPILSLPQTTAYGVAGDLFSSVVWLISFISAFCELRYPTMHQILNMFQVASRMGAF